jgi:ribosomal protein S18 acetylase RimI-like enzyme
MEKQIFINKEAIAYIKYQQTSEGCEIVDIYVKTKFRTQGYGKQLIEYLNQYEIIQIPVTHQSEKISNFWYKMQFREKNGYYLRINKKPYVNMKLFEIKNPKGRNNKLYTTIISLLFLLLSIYFFYLII